MAPLKKHFSEMYNKKALQMQSLYLLIKFLIEKEFPDVSEKVAHFYCFIQQNLYHIVSCFYA